MSAPRLLIVDDEASLTLALRPALEAAGYSTSVVDTGEAAVRSAAKQAYDGIILDLGLPDCDGKDVIQRLRKWTLVPIIVLSARHQEEEVVRALDLGADDFVHKPFNILELMARLRVATRGRDRRLAEAHSIQSGDVEIDFSTRRVSVCGLEVRLTQREYELLLILARYAGRAVTHRQIIEGVWGSMSKVDAQTVRVLVSQLRDKIEPEPSRPRTLLTEPGVGYRLVDLGARTYE